MQKVKVFLDLEETVITNWKDGTLMHQRCKRIRSFLNSLDGFDGTVSIFSFAVHNERDVIDFVCSMRERIEQSLGVTVTECLTVEQMAEKSQQLTGCRWLDGDTMGGFDIFEFCLVKGKQGAFDDVCLFRETNDTRCILIDDVVPDRVTHFKQRNLTIELGDVKAL